MGGGEGGGEVMIKQLTEQYYSTRTTQAHTQGYLVGFFIWHLLWCIDVAIWLDISKDKGVPNLVNCCWYEELTWEFELIRIREIFWMNNNKHELGYNLNILGRVSGKAGKWNPE